MTATLFWRLPRRKSLPEFAPGRGLAPGRSRPTFPTILQLSPGPGAAGARRPPVRLSPSTRERLHLPEGLSISGTSLLRDLGPLRHPAQARRRPGASQVSLLYVSPRPGPARASAGRAAAGQQALPGNLEMAGKRRQVGNSASRQESGPRRLLNSALGEGRWSARMARSVEALFTARDKTVRTSFPCVRGAPLGRISGG